MEVDIGKLDPALASAAIAALGMSASVSYENGTLQIRSRFGALDKEEVQSQFKQSYAAQVVQSQARKYGWQLKETGKFQYEVTKR